MGKTMEKHMESGKNHGKTWKVVDVLGILWDFV